MIQNATVHLHGALHLLRANAAMAGSQAVRKSKSLSLTAYALVCLIQSLAEPYSNSITTLQCLDAGLTRFWKLGLFQAPAKTAAYIVQFELYTRNSVRDLPFAKWS